VKAKYDGVCKLCWVRYKKGAAITISVSPMGYLHEECKRQLDAQRDEAKRLDASA
jgi:hypothetical protein